MRLTLPFRCLFTPSPRDADRKHDLQLENEQIYELFAFNAPKITAKHKIIRCFFINFLSDFITVFHFFSVQTLIAQTPALIIKKKLLAPLSVCLRKQKKNKSADKYRIVDCVLYNIFFAMREYIQWSKWTRKRSHSFKFVILSERQAKRLKFRCNWVLSEVKCIKG